LIINESTARHFFGPANPIGKTIGMDKPGESSGAKVLYQIVGVVKDAKYSQINEEIQRTAYLACAQEIDPNSRMRYEIRTYGPPETMIPSIRKTIAEVNRGRICGLPPPARRAVRLDPLQVLRDE
jgi:hypothetical protein